MRELAVSLVGDELAHSLDSDPAAVVPGAGAPPVVTWLWLIRLWPPAVPDDVDGLPPWRPRQWDGMTRGIARGNPGPAVDLLAGWAADAIVAAMGSA